MVLKEMKQKDAQIKIHESGKISIKTAFVM